MNKQILLTISILISNRPDTVRRCLDSVKPLLEQLPAELILTDTGCGDQVRAIIAEYTDQIIEFEWCKDFSAARNAGLERAKGKWFLYLDDDEWFEDVSAIVRFFRSGEYQAYGFGLYTQRNYLNFEGSEYAELLVSRMIRLEPDIRFVYRIHESFNRAPGLPKKLDAYVHHYGYVYRDEAQRRAHAMRNISLLKEELAAEPRNLKHAMQLAQEYNSIGERQTSLEISLDSIKKAETGPVEGGHCLASLYVNEINCYIELGRFEDAAGRGERYLKDSPADRLAKALIAGRLTEVYAEKEDYGKCLERAEYYWQAYQEYRKNGDEFSEFETPITNTCFHERRLAMILGNGVRAAIHLGKDKLAWQWFRGMGWEDGKTYADGRLVRDILERMLSGDRAERTCCNEMCNILLGHEEWKGFVLQTMMDNCGQGRTFGDKIRAAAAYGDAAGEHWFLKLAGLSALAFRKEAESLGPAGDGENYTPEEAESIAAELWSVMEESMPMMRELNLPEAVRRFGGDNGCVLERIPFSRWERGVAYYFSRYTWKDAAWWQEQFADILDGDSLRMLVWRAGCGISRASAAAAAMERADSEETSARAAQGQEAGKEQDNLEETVPGESGRSGQAEKEDFGRKTECSQKADIDIFGTMESILDGLREYAVCRTALCRRIYREEIIRDMPEILTEEYRGAYAISSLLEMTEKQEYARAVNVVREIKELLPGLAGIMKQYLLWLNAQMERQQEESRQAAGEFQVLARQIKAKVHGLIAAGDYRTALAIMGQLRALLPEDEEISRLEEEVNHLKS